jgi:hypothetical protein
VFFPQDSVLESPGFSCAGAFNSLDFHPKYRLDRHSMIGRGDASRGGAAAARTPRGQTIIGAQEH